jgi:vacuolar-type H+-ATPase subunit F/Vma7
MDSVVALVDEETGLGFRLAGIATRDVDTPGELAEAAGALLSDADARIVLVDETLFRQLPEPLQRRFEANEAPVFVPVPIFRGRRGAAPPEEYIARLMRRAIGYQIRIRR